MGLMVVPYYGSLISANFYKRQFVDAAPADHRRVHQSRFGGLHDAGLQEGHALPSLGPRVSVEDVHGLRPGPFKGAFESCRCDGVEVRNTTTSTRLLDPRRTTALFMISSIVSGP